MSSLKSFIFTVKIIVAIIMDKLEELFLRDKYLEVYAGRISTTELVNRIYNFCEVYSGKVMYKYQTQFSKRIIRSVLENDGAELTALFARQSGKTETIAITVGGLMIILPQLANMPMFAGDHRLEMFKDGFWVGIFAPSMRQSQITYNRMKSRLQCKEALAVLQDPDFRLEFTTSNGQTVSLSNGSFCTAISASDGSNIEGESFKFIICEECFVKGTPILTESGYKGIEEVKEGESVYSYNHDTQKIELKKVVRSFSQPLYGRKIVTITTKSGKKIVCTDNHKIFVPNRNTYLRADALTLNDLVLSYDYTTQESEVLYDIKSDDSGNPTRGRVHTLSRQEVFKESKVCSKPVHKTERVCLEQISEGIRNVPSRTKNCKESGERELPLQIHNKVSARNKKVLRFILCKWKESNIEKHPKFNERGSFSLLVSRRWKFFWNDVYTHSIIYNGGKSAISRLVDQKIWNNSTNSGRQEDRKAFSVLQRNREEQVSEVNTSLCNTRNAVQDTDNRYRDSLQCMWEEGTTIPQEKSRFLFSRVQKEVSKGVYEEVLQTEEIESITIEEREEVEVFDLTVEGNHNFFANSLLVHNCQDISNYKIRKSIHPMGAAYNATICKIGTATTFKGDFYEAIERNKKIAKEKTTHIKDHFEYNYRVVMKYNPRYAKYIEREKRSLGEQSDEFQMAYSLRWILSRSMFIDIDKFEKLCGEETLGRVYSDKIATHSVGIDVGGGSSQNKKEADSTVITVVETDWDNPVLMEKTTDEDTGEDRVYLAYNTYLKDWCEIKPEIAEDYEEQYAIIMTYLANFRILRLTVDATREASLGQRIRANVKYQVDLFTFSTKSKSELYKHLSSEILTGRAKIPMDEETKKTPEYKKFIHQMSDLQKGYSGSNLVVSHPTERGAHDDYCDSWALAVWGARDPGQIDNTETQDRKDLMYGRSSFSMGVYTRHNRRTARRR